MAIFMVLCPRFDKLLLSLWQYCCSLAQVGKRTVRKRVDLGGGLPVSAEKLPLGNSWNKESNTVDMQI
jgi:hypothetical protein